MDQLIDIMFKEYEKAFSTLDVEKNASFYAENIISAGPSGSMVISREEMAKYTAKTAQAYRKIGFKKCRLGNIEETIMSKEYSWIKATWELTFEVEVEVVLKVHMSYIVQKTDPEPSIVFFLMHEDEIRDLEMMGLEISRIKKSSVI